MRRALLVLWLATLGADRIDLLAGSGPMMLRPLLVLIPLILVVEAGALGLGEGRHRFVIPTGLKWFFVGLTLFLSLLLFSEIISPQQELGLRRFALVTVEAFSALTVALVLLNRRDRRSILVSGAYLGLALILLFDVAQLLRWTGLMNFDWIAVGGVIDLSPTTYGALLPRPSGVSLDANRGGFLIVFYVYLVLIVAAPSRRRSVIVAGAALLLLATLSRSALLMAGAVGLFWMLRRGFMVTYSRVGLTAAALALVSFSVLTSRRIRDALGLIGEVAASRASLGEGSASIHLALLERGWEISTSDAAHFFLGIGFGNSYLMLQDFFPGMKYGNFHSAYVSLLVEAGVGALILFLALLLVPLAWSHTFAPLIVGLVAFNVFYQAHVDAILWFILALAWGAPRASDFGWLAGQSRGEAGRTDTSPARASSPVFVA